MKTPEKVDPGARSGASGVQKKQGVGKFTSGQRMRQARTSRFFSAADLGGKPVPPREWIVPDMVPRATVTLLSGDGGTGKSLLMLQLAVACCTGREWLGKAVAPGRVIYVSAEDEEDELHRRLAEILRADGMSYDAVKNLTLRSLAGEDALLAVEREVELVETELFHELEACAASQPPALVLIDTAADVYPSDENFKAKVRQFIGILRGLALRNRCAVVLLSHPSLSGMASGTGTSGNTAWSNSVRSRLYLTRVIDDGQEADPDRRVLTTKKLNYGRTGGEIFLRYVDGRFVLEASASRDDDAGGSKADQVFMKLLRLFTAQGRRVNSAGGLSYAPKVFSEHPDAEGVTKRALKVAMERALSRGKIKVTKDGPASKVRSFLEVVE